MQCTVKYSTPSCPPIIVCNLIIFVLGWTCQVSYRRQNYRRQKTVKHLPRS